jgi:hypothetical protein
MHPNLIELLDYSVVLLFHLLFCIPRTGKVGFAYRITVLFISNIYARLKLINIIGIIFLSLYQHVQIYEHIFCQINFFNNIN